MDGDGADTVTGLIQAKRGPSQECATDRPRRSVGICVQVNAGPDWHIDSDSPLAVLGFKERLWIETVAANAGVENGTVKCDGSVDQFVAGGKFHREGLDAAQ